MSFSCHQNVIKILCRLQANALIDLDLDVPVVDISRSPVETDPNFTLSIPPSLFPSRDRHFVAPFKNCFHIMVLTPLRVSLITAAWRLKAETPRSGFLRKSRSCKTNKTLGGGSA